MKRPEQGTKTLPRFNQRRMARPWRREAEFSGRGLGAEQDERCQKRPRKVILGSVMHRLRFAAFTLPPRVFFHRVLYHASLLHVYVQRPLREREGERARVRESESARVRECERARVRERERERERERFRCVWLNGKHRDAGIFLVCHPKHTSTRGKGRAARVPFHFIERKIKPAY